MRLCTSEYLNRLEPKNTSVTITIFIETGTKRYIYFILFENKKVSFQKPDRSIPLSLSSPKTEFWPDESISNQNQNKFVQGKRKQAPTEKKNSRQKPALKWYPRDLIGWARHHTTTTANQINGGKCIWYLHVYHLTREKERKSEVHYLAVRNDDNEAVA